MRIDPNSDVGGYPILLVRDLVRRLKNHFYWRLETVQSIMSVGPQEARDLVAALEAAGLATPAPDAPAGPKLWTTTQSAQSFGSATAAKPITRQTADKALAEFLERVHRVNSDPYFLAKVTKVVLFGSYLRAEVTRLSDVDIAIQLEPKESDHERLRVLAGERIAELESAGRRTGGWFEREAWWHFETWQFLKSRSRSLSLADYKAEKKLVDQAPHKVLLSTVEE